MHEHQQREARPPQPRWFRRHKKLTIILAIVLTLLVAGGTASALYFLNKKPAEQNVVINEPEASIPEPPKFYSPLTGSLVKSEEITKQVVTGIMIENSPDARPQSGLKDSGVVFEAIAEGGITRFLVLYQEQKPKLIGPVRSLRLYYIDWVAAFDASIAHIGGSRSALQEVRNGKYRDIDQFFNAGAYWRSTDRYAPHNVYTNFQRLDALNKSKGYKTSSFTGFSRKDSEAASEPTATKITVNISGPLYNSVYSYNPKTNTYYRSHQYGGAHKDREAGQLNPRVVIVMEIPETRTFEDGWREQLKTIGKGKATIFQDGTVQKVTWSKSSKTKQLVFTDSEGNDVPLARGQTWLTAVPAGHGGVTWK